MLAHPLEEDQCEFVQSALEFCIVARLSDVRNARQPHGRAISVRWHKLSHGKLQHNKIGICVLDAHVRLARSEGFQAAALPARESDRASRQEQGRRNDRQKSFAHLKQTMVATGRKVKSRAATKRAERVGGVELAPAF